MTNRIPPSLKWLADKRSRLSGEIAKLDSEVAAYKATLKEKASVLRAKKSDLAAIDRALGLHEIQVVADKIAVVRVQNNPIEFSHGEFNKSIFAVLESAPIPMDIPEIAAALAHIKCTVLDDFSMVVLHRNLRHTLKIMARKGVAIRISHARGPQRSLWTAGDVNQLGRIGRPSVRRLK